MNDVSGSGVRGDGGAGAVPGGGYGGVGAVPARRVVVVVSGTAAPAGERPAVHPADRALLLADDLAAVRGDGCFETLLVRDGRAKKVDRHLARLARSSAALGLEVPDDAAWRAGIELAAAEWASGSGAGDGAETGGEAALRLVLSRGPERGGPATAYITVAPVAEGPLRARRDGIDVVTLERGFSVDLAAVAPWQLPGVKSLSYATNMAALRHAAERGCQDVVFLSAEGEILEGPRSTVVIARDGELVSPPPGIGILEGTTLGAVADVARERGIAVRGERLLVTDLVAADAVWLLSSVTLAARVRTLDGLVLPDDEPSVDLPALVEEALGRE